MSHYLAISLRVSTKSTTRNPACHELRLQAIFYIKFIIKANSIIYKYINISIGSWPLEVLLKMSDGILNLNVSCCFKKLLCHSLICYIKKNLDIKIMMVLIYQLERFLKPYIVRTIYFYNKIFFTKNIIIL